MKNYTDPRMHTAEHILNQTMVRMFDCGRCFRSHVEKKKSKCDYHFQRSLSEEEVGRIETQVNEVIERNLPVTAELTGKKEAESIYNLGRLPSGVGEQIRIVKVGDYDACPCIGAHVDSTAEIGAFRITTTNYQDGILRVRFKLS
jgi:alanyl-tRNA synthetase